MTDFKVGDRVRVTEDYPSGDYHDRLGRVVAIESGEPYPIDLDLDFGGDVLVGPHEIERVQDSPPTVSVERSEFFDITVGGEVFFLDKTDAYALFRALDRALSEAGS